MTTLAWGGPRFWQGVWRVAAPKFTLASVASLIVGLAAAAHDGPLRWDLLLETVLGIFFIEAAKNASGEIYDWDSGTDLRVEPEDRSPFSGGKRVLVEAFFTRKQTVAVSSAFYALGAVLGLLIAIREPSILIIGSIGAFLAFFYHATPIQLAYRGLGEAAVFVCYGPLISVGAYLVQRGHIAPSAVHLGVPVGGMVALFLLINEFPDYRADSASGKRNLVVRLGRRAASRLFAALVVVTFAYVLAGPFVFALPKATLLGFIGLPPAIAAARRLWTDHDITRRVVPAQAWTLISFMLIAMGMGAGMLMAS